MNLTFTFTAVAVARHCLSSAGVQRESVIHSVGLLEQMGTQLPFPHSSDLKGSRFASCG
jgi:hypothetical protein